MAENANAASPPSNGNPVALEIAIHFRMAALPKHSLAMPVP